MEHHWSCTLCLPTSRALQVMQLDLVMTACLMSDDTTGYDSSRWSTYQAAYAYTEKADVTTPTSVHV